MRRALLFGLFIALMLTLTSSASAATVYGKVENISQYDHGVIACGIDWSYADAFTSVISGASATDPRSAVLLMQFLRDHTPSCFDVRPDGSFSMNLPDKRFYVVIIALSNDNHVYWYAEQVDASITQVITTTAPSF
jgi:hypothetical protein